MKQFYLKISHLFPVDCCCADQEDLAEEDGSQKEGILKEIIIVLEFETLAGKMEGNWPKKNYTGRDKSSRIKANFAHPTSLSLRRKLAPFWLLGSAWKWNPYFSWGFPFFLYNEDDDSALDQPPQYRVVTKILGNFFIEILKKV